MAMLSILGASSTLLRHYVHSLLMSDFQDELIFF